MSILLLISSGDGPGECQQAVAHTLQRLQAEAETREVSISFAEMEGRHGPKSATVLLSGTGAQQLAERWEGTIQWSAKSKLRPGHKRQNWFIGVYRLPTPPSLETGNIRFETFRAGGPGGQHQNTTDSAVRAVCEQSGLSAVARDGRSQHRNKALAVERLNQLRAAIAETARNQNKRAANLLHHQLERGNPMRRFQGHKFREV